MARVKGPLFSTEAAGQIGRSFLFRSDKRGTHVYQFPEIDRSGETPTQGQEDARARYGQAVEAYRALTDEERATWASLAETDPRPVTGWSLFVERFSQEGPGQGGNCAYGEYQPPDGTAVGFPGQCAPADFPYSPPEGTAVGFQ